MERGVAALCGVIAILLTGCSTIVKGTQQQVSVATPGVQDAMCTLSSPAVGTRAVQTPGTIVLPKSKHDVAVSCVKQCYTTGVGVLASETEIMTAGNVLRWCYRPGDRCRIRRHEQISTWGRNRHESDPQLRGAEKAAERAHGKHSSASTRTTQLSPHIELPIPRLLG
jgi:hypothetical protein